MAQTPLALPGCGARGGTFTEVDDRIAPARAARRATVQVGRDACPVADVTAELGCDWHTANRAVLTWGESLLATDAERVPAMGALDLDETMFKRHGDYN